MPEPILLEVKDGIAAITLNNEKKLNALTGDQLWKLASILEDIAERDDIFITFITGTGQFFSSGADISSIPGTPRGITKDEKRKYWMEHLASHNMHNARAFYKHPKILIAALNGPVVGYMAALVAFSDFIYATESTYLLTPFVSLGLVAEGVASYALTQRMGIAKANDALIRGKRISSQELVQCGFVNDILPSSESSNFKELALAKVRADFGDQLDKGSMLRIKQLIRRPYMKTLDEQSVEEAFVGWQRFVDGLPQQHFQRFLSRRKSSKI